MSRRRLRPVLWTCLAGAVGFASSAIFVSLLQLQREAFVLGYTIATGGFLACFLSLNGIDVKTQIRRRWVSGTLGGILVGLLLVRGVVQQPGSAIPKDGDLVLALAWLAVVYGLVDAVLLSVVPVLALYGMSPSEELQHAPRRLGRGALALAGSLAVTALYHSGFPEFRGTTIVQPLIGNAIITAGYLVTGSPIAPILAHIIMHGAAVLHGMATTVQLPPHY